MARFLTITLLLIFLPTASGVVGAQGPEEFPPDVIADLQTAMDAATEASSPPGMVVWIDTPDHRFEGASGYADTADQIPMPADGAFRIGSITKLFTAAVILQLSEEGILSLDDPLAAWLPDVAAQLPHGDQITLRQLLSHTAGVYSFTDNAAYWEAMLSEAEVNEETDTAIVPCQDRTPTALLEMYVYDQNARFEPGVAGRWSYSNTGFVLLGMVIEAAAGMPLAEVYRSRIFEPLDMQNTYLDCYESPTVDLVHSYSRMEGHVYDVTEVHDAGAWAAGGIISTAPDLIVFARALFEGELFQNAATLTTMTTEVSHDYALGVILDDGTWGHDGGIIGFLTSLRYYPDEDAVIVVLYNADNADPSVLANYAAEALEKTIQPE